MAFSFDISNKSSIFAPQKVHERHKFAPWKVHESNKSAPWKMHLIKKRMDITLINYMKEQLELVSLAFKRYNYDKLPWEARLVGLMGPRGVQQK